VPANHRCGQHLAFKNSLCLSCGSALGFSLDEGVLLVIAAAGTVSTAVQSMPASIGYAPISMRPNAIGWSRGTGARARMSCARLAD
jgi:zinc-ribbon domain